MAYRILITGCSSGIGRALAITLAERGHYVIATARDIASIAGIGAMRLALDITSDNSVAAAALAAGPVDVVVNNAGLGIWSPVELVTLEQAKALFEVNFFGALRMQRSFLPVMRAKKGGQIIQISSAVGRVTGPLVGHYAASKHALEAMSAALRIELAGFNIKVAIIELGAVESSFADNRMLADTDADYAPVIAHFTKKLSAMRVTPVSSHDCAAGIAEVIESGAPDMMVEGTADVAKLVGARFGKTDQVWESELIAGM